MMKRLCLLSALLCASQSMQGAAGESAAACIIKTIQPAGSGVSWFFSEETTRPKGPYVGVTACLVMHPQQVAAQAISNCAMKSGFMDSTWEERGRSELAKTMTTDDLAKGTMCWPKIIALIEVSRPSFKSFPDVEVFVRTDRRAEGFPCPFMKSLGTSLCTNAMRLRLPKCLISFSERGNIEEFSEKPEIVELLRRGPAGEAALQKAWHDYLRETKRFGVEVDLAAVEVLWQKAAASAK